MKKKIVTLFMALVTTTTFTTSISATPEIAQTQFTYNANDTINGNFLPTITCHINTKDGFKDYEGFMLDNQVYVPLKMFRDLKLDGVEYINVEYYKDSATNDENINIEFKNNNTNSLSPMTIKHCGDFKEWILLYESEGEKISECIDVINKDGCNYIPLYILRYDAWNISVDWDEDSKSVTVPGTLSNESDDLCGLEPSKYNDEIINLLGNPETKGSDIHKFLDSVRADAIEYGEDESSDYVKVLDLIKENIKPEMTLKEVYKMATSDGLRSLLDKAEEEINSIPQEEVESLIGGLNIYRGFASMIIPEIEIEDALSTIEMALKDDNVLTDIITKDIKGTAEQITETKEFILKYKEVIRNIISFYKELTFGEMFTSIDDVKALLQEARKFANEQTGEFLYDTMMISKQF